RGEAPDVAAHDWAGEVEPAAAGGADDEHDRRVGVVAEAIAQRPRRHLALGAGVRESRRLQVMLDVVAYGDRQQGEGADHREDQLGVSPGEVRDPGHRRFNAATGRNVRPPSPPTVPEFKVVTLKYKLRW